ncbi:type II secretion system protein [Sporolactobacillus sp. THM7-4]|nr:type II secretion system protein [Sporolactobacillus sp. THM7-4]
MTLVEVLAAITLLSFILLTFSVVFIQSSRVTTFNGIKLSALQLGQKRLSSVLSANSLPDAPAIRPDSPTQEPEGTKYILHDDSDTQTIGHTTFQLYVYILTPTSDGDQPVIVRTYYNPSNYVELYNYYTTNPDREVQEDGR